MPQPQYIVRAYARHYVCCDDGLSEWINFHKIKMFHTPQLEFISKCTMHRTNDESIRDIFWINLEHVIITFYVWNIKVHGAMWLANDTLYATHSLFISDSMRLPSHRNMAHIVLFEGKNSRKKIWNKTETQLSFTHKHTKQFERKTFSNVKKFHSQHNSEWQEKQRVFGI